MHPFRSHTCAELNSSHVGETVRLSGWVHRVRDHGGVLFIDLRDHYGVTQVLCDPDSPVFHEVEKVRSEWCIRIDGNVKARDASLVNAKIPTGEIEVFIRDMEVLGSARELPLMVFGHGLFGTGEEYLTDGFLQEVANDYCMIVVASDWIGLSARQLADAARAANDLNRVNPLTDKLGQAVVNFVALQELARGQFASDPLFARDGTPMIDTEQVFYLGASLGGIMGGTYMAYDPHIERGVLGVPGGAWSILIERSFAWSPLQGAAMNAYTDPYDYQLLVALLAMRFDRFDPITTASNVIADPLPGTPAKQLMLYQAVNDSLVNNLSTETLARSLELDLAGPSVSEPFGLSTNDQPLTSGLLILDDKVSAPSDSNVPPASDNGTHSGINSRPALLRSIQQFYFDGSFTNQCKIGDEPAVCDCTTGACQ